MSAARITVVRRRTIIIAVVLLLLIIVAATMWLWSGQTTAVQVYNPVGFQATETVEGSCWTGSLGAPRAGAYRCASGNSIYDPCFSTNGSVACPEGDPSENKGVLINLTEPLPVPPEAWENPPDLANPTPWQMTLAGGGVCGALTGTRPPEFPMGCQLPGPPESSLFCSLPIPVTGSPGEYASVCGTISGDAMEIINRQIYTVKDMWL